MIREGQKRETVARIHEHGFEIHNRLLMPSECDRLVAELSASDVLRSRAGARHLISMPGIAMLASDPRMRTLAADALGGRAVPFRATLFDKSAESNWSVVWHQDTALPLATRFETEGWGPWSVKAGVMYAHAPASALNRVIALRIHLDESTSTNGPLRVLAGTHKKGLLTDEQVAELARISAATECLVGRGGVLMMRPLLVHSSTRVVTKAARRVLHIEYAEDLEVAPGVHLTQA
jgi:hypothetical protein